KPGGRLLVLEFSKPTNPLMSKAYDLYSFTALPFMGKVVTNDAESYKYLAESIRMHPDQETLKSMMEEAGLVRCSYHNMTSGVVALHRGIKPCCCNTCPLNCCRPPAFPLSLPLIMCCSTTRRRSSNCAQCKAGCWR